MQRKEKQYPIVCKQCQQTVYRRSRGRITQQFCSSPCQRNYRSIKLYNNWFNGGKIGRHCLKTNLIRIYGNVCSICKITEWQSKLLKMELDHIDGNPYNNTPENIRLICPNCHAQTESYKGKNKGNGRSTKDKGWLLEGPMPRKTLCMKI